MQTVEKDAPLQWWSNTCKLKWDLSHQWYYKGSSAQCWGEREEYGNALLADINFLCTVQFVSNWKCTCSFMHKSVSGKLS